MLSIIGVMLLPILTIIGDHQWLTFTVVNTSFFSITTIEIDKYLFFLKYKNDFKRENLLIQYHLTTKEMEIATLILQNHKYKKIADMVYIAEKTVSKHASNIFKKTQVKNKEHFLKNFNNL